MGVRMQTFLIRSRDIEALHYNPDARLLLINTSAATFAASPAFHRKACGGCSAPVPASTTGMIERSAISGEIRKGGLKALYRLTESIRYSSIFRPACGSGSIANANAAPLSQQLFT
nr:hypothetical protein [Rhizobium sophorae]